MKKRQIYAYFIIAICLVIAIFGIYYFGRSLLRTLQDDILSLIFILASIILFIISLAFVISDIQRAKQSQREKLLENRLQMWNSISYKVKKAGEKAFNNLPIGIIVINSRNNVVWSNESAKMIFMSQLDNLNLNNISAELYDQVENKEKKQEVAIYGKIYDVQYLEEYGIIYLTDVTHVIEIEQRYHEHILAVGYINIDNLEEALLDFDVQERAEHLGKIIGCIGNWAEKYDAYVRAYSENRYLLLTNRAHLMEMMQTNFGILDEIKNIIQINRFVRITLSIGIACSDVEIDVLAKQATIQLELALSRGGDQAVVKIGDSLEFFGAKTDAEPKDSKVEVRTKSEELQELIKSSRNVFVVGHSTLDADGFGGTLGIYRLAKSLGKEAYIILDDKSIDATVKHVYETILKEYVILVNDIVKPQQALKALSSDSLLMVVDCQSDILLSEPRLVSRASKIGVIDHHRRGQGAIQKPDFYYGQPTASSSVELIVELLQFCETPYEIVPLEATWMLLGLVVDTNNFVYRTNAKTFEVAATLKKFGADMAQVKAYLKEDMGEKLIRNDFISNMQVMNNGIAISVSKSDVIYERATLAKISDEMISISGVSVGITVGFISDGVVGISARSLGQVNVQTLMEKMGGGGHLTGAAAQIKGMDINQVVEKLKDHIDDYFRQEEKMKIILKKEVKGRGRKDDIIEAPAGYANHLIRQGLAILASPDNIKMVENEKHVEAIKAEKLLEEMKTLKEFIEAHPITIPVRVGAEGKLFGSVSMKNLVDSYEKEYGVVLDKRKINYEEAITKLGTFDIPIQLHKEVLATIKLYVVEKE